MRAFCLLLMLVAGGWSKVFAVERVVVLGDALTGSEPLLGALRAVGWEVQVIDATQLSRLDQSEARLAVIGPDGACPPESRRALTEFLRQKKNVIVVGAGAFDYAPKPVRGLAAVDLADARGYEVLQPKARGPNERYAVEPARVSRVTTPAGGLALSFRTYLRGMNDTWLKFSSAGARDASRTVLTFWGRGDAYADLLALEIVDTKGGRWLSYVPLSAEWKHYAVTLADFLPRGWAKAAEPYPLLQAAEIATVALGIDAATIWREKPMAFAVGGIALAEEADARYAPTSDNVALRLPFQQNATAVPTWLFNPFQGARRLGGTEIALHAATGGTTVKVDAAWSCPTPLVFHPGVQMGTDHRAELDTKAEREQRRIELWRTAAGEVAAELRFPAGAAFVGAGIALFGVSPTALAREAALRDSLVETAKFLLGRPRIVAAVINTTAPTAAAPSVPALRVQAHNPLDRVVRGTLAIEVGGERVRGAAPVELPARGSAEVVVPLSAVPPDFPFARFDWSVTLETPDAGRDVFGTTVDTERALLQALGHLVRTQRQFPDGRISHHYFGDAYGVRGIFAYLDLVRREPARLQRNRDLWAITSVDELRACGLRFVDMLLQRQNEDGSVPMGYGEQSATYNVADGGQIALAMGQVAPLLDETRREACWQFCRRFAAWAETFYIDEELSAKLIAETPAAKQVQAKAGHYGLGSSRGVRNPLGPSWVLPDILGVQLLLPYVDANPDYRFIADRNIRAYLDAGYGAVGYFHAEALTWAWRDATDADLRRRIAETLTGTFVPPLLSGKEDAMFELGARGTLRALPMIYYRRYVEDTAEVRAALLKYVWAFGSETSERSMRRLAEAHPKPHHGESIAASKYASFSAIWAVELLEPGASFLRVPGFPRGMGVAAAPR